MLVTTMKLDSRLMQREVEQNTVLVPDFGKVNYQGLRHHLQSIDCEGMGVGREKDQNIEVELHYNSLVREIHTGQESIYQRGRLG